MNKRVTFQGFECEVHKITYNNGRVGLQLNDIIDGCPIATATINMPEIELAPDEVIIKDYSDNTGMTEVLVQGGVIELTNRKAMTGYVYAPICKLL